MRAKVLEIAVDEPLRPHAVGAGYDTIVLVVRAGRDVLAQISLPALEVLPVDVQRSAIAARLGVELWRREAADVLRRSLGIAPSPAPRAPSVSVVVCTRDRPDDLERCLTALGALVTPPHEILVVDNAPSDDSTRLLCASAGVRYVLEPLPGQSRARNRGIAETTGELVAFTDDDCVPDTRWLDDLARDLADPLVLALTGHVAPLELETPSQFLFEAHGGFNRGFRRRVFDGVWVNPALTAGRVGAGANVIFRREAFERIGLFAEHLGPGTAARAADDNDVFCRILDAGYRIAYDPARLVWHRHRRDPGALKRIVFDYGVSSSAFAFSRAFGRRDPGALRILTWWWLEHAPADLAAIVRRRPARLPLRAVAAELLGTLVGPWALARSRRSRRGIAPLTGTGASEVVPPPLRVVEDAPALSVVVPTRDRRDRLQATLEALARQTLPPERAEVVVVLDGCTDGSADLVRGLDVPYALVAVEAAGEGVAAARNRGIRAASNPIVVFLDDDIVAEPGCLAAHAAAHAAGPEGVAVGYCPPVVGDGWFGQRLRSWWEDHYRRAEEPGHRWTYYDFTTGNTSLPRELLLRLGGFDEAFGSRHEDWELGVRLLKAEVPFSFHRDTLARHHLDPSLATAVRHQRLEGQGDVLLARKHPEIARQLPLAGYAAGLPRSDGRRVAAALRRAERLERLGLRTRWRRAASAALHDAYVLGVRDELGDADVHDLLRDAAPPVEVDVHLDGDRPPPELPPLGHVAFVLRDGGEEVARVEPVLPGRQWGWEDALERTLESTLGDVGMALFRRELALGGAPAAHPEVAHVP